MFFSGKNIIKKYIYYKSYSKLQEISNAIIIFSVNGYIR